MGAVTSAAEAGPFATIVVVGGGCYGSWYVQQLARARAAGKITWERLVVVDRNPDCQVASGPSAHLVGLDLAVAEWTPWFAEYLERAGHPAYAARDAIVPSPLMPHLMFEWMVARAVARWPHRPIGPRPLPVAPPVPWQRAGADGTHYASFAEWTCPTNCIEPAKCPATRGERTWSMPTAVRQYVDAQREVGTAIGGPVVLHCEHRTFGVGMFDTAAVVAGDRVIAAAGATGPTEVLVATVSHCHGAWALLGID